MNNKLVLIISGVLLTGVFAGYLISLKEFSQDKKNSNYLSDEITRENCYADDCLYVENLEYPVDGLTQEAQTALITAINDEYKAHSTYESVIEKFGNVRPFSMIIRAEEQHIASLKSLFDKYGIDIPENNLAVETSASLKESCQIGVDAEIANAALYREELLPVVTDYADITAVFTNLMKASENKHLVAFERCN